MTVYDLYCGQFWGSYLHADGTWHSPFVDEGWRVIGFDLMDVSKEFGEAMPLPAGCELRIRDVLTIHGSELADADLIVASPPCTEPSYRAMPWKRAKALNAAGPPHKFIELFETCFRIQREASEAKGEHVPLIVENVAGAQRWVGRAAWHFGSYYLWGDVPALMPMPKEFKNSGGSWYAVAHNTDSGHSRNPVNFPEHTAGVKGFTPQGQPLGKNELGRRWGSKSTKRKLASAMIAKIPYPLALHIARCVKPQAEVRAL